MKIYSGLAALVLVGLTACSSTARAPHAATKADPETMLITYHVKPGKVKEFQAVLARAWEIYRTEHLVLAEPHLLVRDTDDDGKPRFVESFTWASHSGPDHAPQSVKAIWNEEQTLCEARNGHRGIEGGEVELLLPRH